MMDVEQARSSAEHEVLGGAFTDAAVTELVRATLDDQSAHLSGWYLEPVDYAYGSPNTGGLFRLRAEVTSHGADTAWSAFVKVVRSFRHWPLIDVLPQPLREQALAGVEWRYEVDAYRSDLGTVLPIGMRLPELHSVVDLGDDRLAMVLEDVVNDSSPWAVRRFARAAGLLGRLAVRLTDTDSLPATASRVSGEATGRFYTARVLPAILPMLADDGVWQHPLLVGHDDLRRDAVEAARRLPAVVAGLARCPQLLSHGDASPQNLLVPVDDPDSFVAVDWTLGGLTAVGDDLGQLLVGLCHAGELGASELPPLRDTVVDAYAEGLAAEGVHIDPSVVAYGLDGGLAIRSALTALPFERLHEPVTDELAELCARRIELTRYLVQTALSLPDAPPSPRIPQP